MKYRQLIERLKECTQTVHMSEIVFDLEAEFNPTGKPAPDSDAELFVGPPGMVEDLRLEVYEVGEELENKSDEVDDLLSVIASEGADDPDITGVEILDILHEDGVRPAAPLQSFMPGVRAHDPAAARLALAAYQVGYRNRGADAGVAPALILSGDPKLGTADHSGSMTPWERAEFLPPEGS